MKKTLIQFLFWILRKLSAEFYLAPVSGYTLTHDVMKLIPMARIFVAQLDSQQQAGEWKKHQVYARMLKNNPGIAKRDISLAIELAVREL
jgi:hypothetical protein